MKRIRTDRLYEAAFIVRPTVSDEGVDALITSVQESLASRQAEVTLVEKWGRRRLAYPIAKHSDGSYVLLHVRGSGPAIVEAERRLGLNEDVLRFLSVRIDDAPGAIEAGEARLVRKARQEEERELRATERARREAELAEAEDDRLSEDDETDDDDGSDDDDRA